MFPRASQSPGGNLEALEAEIRRFAEPRTPSFGEQREVLKISGHPLRSAAQRYARIKEMSGQYKVAWLCEALLVSRSGYYDWKERSRRPGPRQVENMRLRQRIKEEFTRSRETGGSPRLAQALGCPGRRNRIARLMRAEHLFARQRVPSIASPRPTVATVGRSRL